MQGARACRGQVLVASTCLKGAPIAAAPAAGSKDAWAGEGAVAAARKKFPFGEIQILVQQTPEVPEIH